MDGDRFCINDVTGNIRTYGTWQDWSFQTRGGHPGFWVSGRRHSGALVLEYTHEMVWIWVSLLLLVSIASIVNLI